MKILPTFKALQAKKQQNVQTNPQTPPTEIKQDVKKDEFIKTDNGTVVEVKK